MMAYGEQAETDDPVQHWGGSGNPHRGSSKLPFTYIIFTNLSDLI